MVGLIYFIKTYFSLNLSEAICKRLSVTVSQISLSLLLTKINLRLPPSSAFNSKQACPVVPLPAKKSSISESPDVVARINSFISFSGFGVEKYSLFPNRLFISSFADDVVPKQSNTSGTSLSFSFNIPFSMYGCINFLSTALLDFRQTIIYS